MPKNEFIKVAKQLYWNHTLEGYYPMNSLHIFRTPFFDITAGGLLWSIIYFISHVCIHFFTCQISKVILHYLTLWVLMEKKYFFKKILSKFETSLDRGSNQGVIANWNKYGTQFFCIRILWALFSLHKKLV